MIVQHFFIKGIAHSSYLVGGNENCAIVDPSRDVKHYIDAAKELGLAVTHILETHLHADFVSGHLELAEKTGATIYAPAAGNCRFDHIPAAEGTTFRIEDMSCRVIETPGHTPEAISYVVTDLARGEKPVAAFTGDALFVGDVGRPDLFPGKAKDLASQLYDSLHERLLTLPDFCEVYPTHGAGSLCGRALGAKRWSTIGYEKMYNTALQIEDREEFIRSLTTNMPGAPDHFSRCSAINRKGPPLIRSLPRLKPLDAKAFSDIANETKAVVLDVRGYDAYGGQHIPGSYHIDLAGNFATFAGWVLPPDTDILLVSEDPCQAENAQTWLRRVGLDRTVGFLDGGVHAWTLAGFNTDHVPQVSSQEVHGMIISKSETLLLDVRSPEEYEETHVSGGLNIPVPDLRTRTDELDPNRGMILMCRTGHRSSLGCSLLKQKGFEKVFNAAGGITGYTAAGFIP